MPSINLYLSDALHRQVKESGMPVSEVCQRALRAELVEHLHRRQSKPIPGQLAIETPREQ